MTHFEFQKRKKPPFWKQLRIHPLFSFWKQQIVIFFIFLFSVSLFFVVFSSSLSLFHFKNIWKEAFFQKEFTLSSFKQDISHLIENMPDMKDPRYSLYAQGKPHLINIFNALEEIEDALFFLPQNFENESDIEKISVWYLKNLSSFQNLFSSASFFIENSDILSYLETDTTKFLQKFSEKDTVFFKNLPNTLAEILGNKSSKTIGVWLENNAEERAGGGFIGSFLLGDIFLGKFTSLEFYDIYDFDGQSPKKEIFPRNAKSLLGEHLWSLRDSNTSPIFQESAQNFLSFFEESGGKSVDMVFSLNTDMIRSLLQKTGPLFIEEFQTSIDEKNFLLVLSFFIEGKVFSEGKNMLWSSVFPPFLKQVSKKLSFQEIFDVMKQTRAFSPHDSFDSFLSFFFEDKKGKEYQNSELFINKISISGNKSSAYINEKIYPIKKGLKIERTHQWGTKEEKLFSHLLNNFSPHIPHNILHNIVGKGGNRMIYQFTFKPPKKNIQINNTPCKNTWYENSKTQVCEYLAEELFPGETQTLILQYE
jgi:hypothetical protein